MKLEGRLLLLLLVVSLAVACFIKTNLNKREGEYEFEVKRENSSGPASMLDLRALYWMMPV